MKKNTEIRQLCTHFTPLLTLFGMGFFMYVKCMEGDKITPQSKTFKNDAKKLKLTHKLEILRNFPKYQKKNFAINIS